MVEKIKDIKDEILTQVEEDMHEGGADQIDPKMIDQIKDLAEAEKSCWEAEYYRSVSEAMEDGSMGYEGGQGYREEMGYAQGGRGGRGYAQGGRGGSQGGSGYRQGGRGYRRGYEQGSGYERGGRRGYRGQSRDSQGRYTSRRGYRRMEGGYGHDDMLMDVRQMMESADPQEREQLKQQLRQMAEQM